MANMRWDVFCQNTIDNDLGDQNSYFVVGDMQEPPELEWVADLPHGRVEEFDFESGEQFLSAPLIGEFLMHEWLALVPAEQRVELFEEISRLINEERHEAEFALSVKATLMVGQKAHSH